jgi:hypothetical protein
VSTESYPTVIKEGVSKNWPSTAVINTLGGSTQENMATQGGRVTPQMREVLSDFRKIDGTDDLRALDLRIARYLGWTVVGYGKDSFPPPHSAGEVSIFVAINPERDQTADWMGFLSPGTLKPIPRFTSDIAAAWWLMEKAIRDGWTWPHVHIDRVLANEWLWRVNLHNGYPADNGGRGVMARDESLPLAICRAFEAAYLNAPDCDLQRPAPEPAATPGD